MSGSVYIHYGSPAYDKLEFHPIKNEMMSVKPTGGLWASRVGDMNGWKALCDTEGIAVCEETNSFKFTIASGAHVVTIRKPEDLDRLPHVAGERTTSWDLIDFEALQEAGVDAVEVFVCFSLIVRLNGWDCNSLLVLNKDVIEPIK